MDPNAEPTLTVAEVAARRRVNRKRVLEWIAAGDLEAVDVTGTGGKRATWRISEDALAAFDEKRRYRPAPPARTKWSRPRRTSRVVQFH